MIFDFRSQRGQIQLQGLIVASWYGKGPAGIHEDITGIGSLSVDRVAKSRVQSLQAQAAKGNGGLSGAADNGDQRFPAVLRNLLPGRAGVLERVAETVVVPLLDQVCFFTVSRSSGVQRPRSIS